MVRPMGASHTCRSAGWVNQAPAGGRRVPKHRMCIPSGRRCTSTTRHRECSAMVARRTQTVSIPAVALIPARAGSKRLEGKNVRLLAGHPLIAYAIAAALDSAVFDAVIVSTDSADIAAISRYYGAEVPALRPSALADDLSPDLDWVRHTLQSLRSTGRNYECFSILRPTSPFRTAATVRRAWEWFGPRRDVDSLRAVERCKQHPGKMWKRQGDRIVPLLDGGPTSPPWHSMAYQSLPEVLVQN